MRERGIPFSISDFYTLSVVSALDLGLFRQYFNNFEFAKINIGDLFEGGYLKFLTSVVGYSVFNKFSRLKKQLVFWTLMYDIVITGASFDSALPSFIALLLKYSMYLYRQTDAVVMGFFTDDESENEVVTVF
jgi:hypothetical protein